MTATVASIPIFALATSKSVHTESNCAAMKPGGAPCTPCTPTVFCAVSAVMTEAP